MKANLGRYQAKKKEEEKEEKKKRRKRESEADLGSVMLSGCSLEMKFFPKMVHANTHFLTSSQVPYWGSNKDTGSVKV